MQFDIQRLVEFDFLRATEIATLNCMQWIADADVQASLGHLHASDSADADSCARRPTSVGTPTSSGLRFRVLRPHAKGGLGQVSVALDEELQVRPIRKESDPWWSAPMPVVHAWPRDAGRRIKIEQP